MSQFELRKRLAFCRVACYNERVHIKGENDAETNS